MTATQNLSFVSLIANASLLVQLVMLLLLVVSVMSWHYIFRKMFAIRKARADRLGRLGLSAAKIKTLKLLAREIASERLNLEVLAEEAGYLAFVLSSDGKPKLEERAIETFKAMNVAGAVIAPLGVQSHHDKLARLGASIPMIYVDSQLDAESAFVGTNNRQSFRLIVDYLSRSGDAPCYFGMPSVNRNAIERREAYRLAMEALKLEPRYVATLPDTSWDFERFGFTEAVRTLGEGGFPTRTVLCANDRIAFGVLAAAYQAGLKVGRGDDCDLRIAGHDDHPLSRYTCPPLTTVAQNYNEIGRIAVELLLHKINARFDEDVEPHGNERVLLNAEIMLRTSA